MSKEQNKELLQFLAFCPVEKQEIILWLRNLVWDQYPHCNELIYDNYNAVSFGWSPTEKLGQLFCSVAVFRTNYNIHFGFYWGNEIADPEKKLLGKGKQYRYIRVDDIKTFPKAYIRKLVKKAYSNSLAKVKDKKDLRKGETIVKSISPKRRTIKKVLPKRKQSEK